MDGDQWEKVERILLQYDENNNSIGHTHHEWDGNNWKMAYRRGFRFYDINNNCTEYIHEWLDFSGWVNEFKITFLYDENYNKTEEITQFWENSNWVNGYKDLYKYITVTDINNQISTINNFSLSNNYPNPFNPSTTIKYSIPKQSNVTLKVFDVLGSEMLTLVNKEQSHGNYEIEFNGSELTSGIYFYRLQAGDFVETKKMILLK